MANQPESAVYDAGVFQLETVTPVRGGVGGESNAPLLSLANRTAYLKQHIDAVEATLATTFAPLNSPAMTGTPTAPTAALGDRSTKVANTQFVQDTVNGIASINVAGGVDVVLSAVQAGAGTLVLTGLITANINVVVPATARKWVVSNQTTGAFSLTVKTAAGTGIVVSQGKNSMLWCDATNVLDAKNDFVGASLVNSTANDPTLGDRTGALVNTRAMNDAMDGVASVNVAGNLDVVLTQAQWGKGILKLTGVLTGSIGVIVPGQSDQWTVSNGTTGPFSITVKLAGSSGVVVPQGMSMILYSDGTEVYQVSAPNVQTVTTTTATATGGQTSFPATYTPGNLQVFRNGNILRPTADYAASDGVSVVLGSGSTAGDLIEIVVFSSFQVAGSYTKAEMDTRMRAAAARSYYMGQMQ